MASVFPQRRVVELQPGLAQVTGRVVPAGPPVRAPLSGRPCVYYQVIGRNHVWPWHDRLCYPTAEVCFWIDDDGARLWIVVPRSPTSQSSPGATEAGASFQCSIVGEVVRRRSTRASRRRLTASSSRRPIRFGPMPTSRLRSESLPRTTFSAWVEKSSKRSIPGNDPPIPVSRRRECSCGRDPFAAPAPDPRGRNVPARGKRPRSDSMVASVSD